MEQTLVEQTGDEIPPGPADVVFMNPILPAPSQDPRVIFHRGHYYYIEAHTRKIFLRRTPDFLDLRHADKVCVWRPPSRGPSSHNLWAPELHHMNGRWYIYYAADDGRNINHRMFVLESVGDDPMGPYLDRGPLRTDGWAIDGTVLEAREGGLIFVWSGWPGRRNRQQNLYAASMSDPLTVSGPRRLLAEPDQPWERRGLPICEGPEILQRDGRTFIVYSASASWTEDYCLGMLVNEGGDYLDPGAWRKLGPVFSKTETTWGVGHCSFVRCHQQHDWILYHAKTNRAHGWRDRNVRAQRFTWSSDGLPEFGRPIDPRVRSPLRGSSHSLETPGHSAPFMAAGASGEPSTWADSSLPTTTTWPRAT